MLCTTVNVGGPIVVFLSAVSFEVILSWGPMDASCFVTLVDQMLGMRGDLGLIRSFCLQLTVMSLLSGYCYCFRCLDWLDGEAEW